MVSAYLDEIRNSAPADPSDPVMVPGDRARNRRAQNLAEGLYLDDGLWRDLLDLRDSCSSKAVSA